MSGLSSASAPRANQPAFGYTPEKSALALTSYPSLVTVEAALQSVNVVRPVAPPKCRVTSRDRTSREVLRPSGDITCGVRLTRDFHPRHLPPLGFLNPPTVSSSAWLACRISYRHHLWGSKLKEQKCDSSSVLISRSREGSSQRVSPAQKREASDNTNSTRPFVLRVRRMRCAFRPPLSRTSVALAVVNVSLT